jgi:uncharacterized protein
MKVRALNKEIRILPKGFISVRHDAFLLLITLLVGFVDGCQLCIRNIVATNIPISFRHSISSESFPREIERKAEASRLMLSYVEYSGKSVSFIPRQRQRYPPLFMMFNSDSNNETSVIDTGNNVVAESNQTNFDSVKFFDELERSGDIPTNDQGPEEDTMSIMMSGAIGFYKKVISPLLPPACRFVPTCSTYGVQAIKEFGPTKGIILIAWRILRCTPIGGKGYDPPTWPPVFYTFSSY